MSEFTAKKIKEARVRAGITQDEAATLIKIKKSTISDIESAKRNITADELAQFSRIYNVDVRELLFVDFTAEGEEITWALCFENFSEEAFFGREVRSMAKKSTVNSR